MLQTTFPATLRAHRFFIPLQLLLNGPEHTQKVLYQFQVFSFLKLFKLKAFFHFIFCIRKSNILYFHNIALYTIPICAYYIYMYFTFIYLYFNYVKSLHLLYTIFNYLPKSSVIFCITYVLMLYCEFYSCVILYNLCTFVFSFTVLVNFFAYHHSIQTFKWK